MNEGWIKLHRKTLENPIVCKDSDHLALWIYLLANATHTEYGSMFKGERITLQPGQLLAGRKSIASFLKVNENKVQRMLKSFEIEQQIKQQTSNQNRLISILNWTLYQSSEQQSEQQVNNKRTTSEQQVNTNKNVKNIENVKNDKNYKYIVEYLNQKTGKSFSTKTKSTTAKIHARLEEGFTVDDFKKVIDIKTSEWLSDANMQKYLRPETLFGNKFESYLNQKLKTQQQSSNPFLEMLKDEMVKGEHDE
ncbi:conserved phage C-terminal domain-containing protein [Alkalibaculum sporogenes]|nr:conserved phage C-terminal domain-containing protein [Alkalibaculum sporogenes]